MKLKENLSTVLNIVSAGQLKYGWWTLAYASDARPVILGGCGRSGTTLLRAMLNAHPRIFIGPETGIFCGHKDLSLISDALQIPMQETKSHYRSSRCMGEFVERIMHQVLSNTGKPRWGEKSPRNVQNLHTIFHFFPHAQFIHVIRDGRDVVCSLRTHPKYVWVSGNEGDRVPTGVCNPWSECVGRWVRDTSFGLQWRQDSRYREVRYEQLVTQPEHEMRQILDWLGEAWDDSVLTYHSTHQARSSDAANPGVTKPIYVTAVSKWKTGLPQDALESFTPDAMRLLRELEYAQDDTWRDELVRAEPRDDAVASTLPRTH